PSTSASLRLANAVVRTRRATKPPIAACAVGTRRKRPRPLQPVLNGIQYSRLVPSRLIPSEQLNYFVTRLAYFNDVAVWIAHVATGLPPVIVQRFSDELRPLCLPLSVAGPNVSNAQIQEAAHNRTISRRLQRHIRLVRRGTSAAVQNDPRVRQLDDARVLRSQDLTPEYTSVELARPCLVAHR